MPSTQIHYSLNPKVDTRSSQNKCREGVESMPFTCRALFENKTRLRKRLKCTYLFRRCDEAKREYARTTDSNWPIKMNIIMEFYKPKSFYDYIKNSVFSN